MRDMIATVTALRHSVDRALLIGGYLLCCFAGASAEQPHIVVEPYGTNQLRLSATALQPEVYYTVMARSNSPDAHWVGIASIIENTNGRATVFHTLGSDDQLGALKGLTLKNVRSWTFAIGSAEDADGNGLYDVWDELAMRADPYEGADGYADPDQDGWVNLQEMQNYTNPFLWDTPPPPQGINLRASSNNTVVLQWHNAGGGLVDYFLIQKAQKTLLPDPDRTPMIDFGKPINTNAILEYWARTRNGRANRRPRSFLREDVEQWETNRFQLLAKVPAQPGKLEYQYVDTAVTNRYESQPLYRVQAHYLPAQRAYLQSTTAAEVRQTLLKVQSRAGTNGYDLTLSNPIPFGWYLLLVRDKTNPKWRASGYFVSGTNRAPVSIHVDSKGMMGAAQAPATLPPVKALPDVAEPEFIAGWGDDSDGDGLPDIFEVLVTRTEPDDADTGDTGVLDGFRDMAGDGFTTLEKFRHRVDPREVYSLSRPATLHRPTLLEFWRALQSAAPRTDLHLHPVIFVKLTGEVDFKPLNTEDPAMSALFGRKGQLRDSPIECDLQLSWKPAGPKPHSNGYLGP